MKKQSKALLATAALTGLLMGSDLRVSAATVQGRVNRPSRSRLWVPCAAVGLDDTTQPATHDCKGKNDCKGQGGCKTGDQGCKGKNSCKGNGGCKTSGSALMF